MSFYGKGINDMPKGWYSESEYNKRVYRLWYSMLERCYSKKYHERHQTYKNCTVCEKWLTLSNFVEDVVKIDGYNYWLSGFGEKINHYQLDKDIKSNGKNKEYSLENCMFANQSENLRQANATRDYEQFRGEKAPMYGRTGEKNPMYGRTGEKAPMYGRTGENHPKHGELVAQIDKDTNKILNLKYNMEYSRLGFNQSNISACCKGKCKTHKGFIFKYISDCSDEQINELEYKSNIFI